ncbi:Permease of the drug/metabolite transporter (DMT) superfamily [Rhizobium sp. RU20A]|uniref:DMT family transporter n=1 Tax=Rhizobium sp. RU20A TaxID=1907412 RepID=UPI000956E6AF|nr:DMT family transporter [Rhizobium sp. RU20A]SIQ13958.1 Permease of the drug/metabolite transporter (DMT) superfamily [Rhizobium sp. RU20A]
MPAAAPLSANVKGVIFMALAMAGFSMNDALVKSVTGEMGTAQIMFLRGLMTSVLVIALAWQFGALRPGRIALTPVLALRIFAEVGASLTYISALGQIPLANAAAILQALPLAVTLGAALFLGEPVGWRRWMAIVVGFIGVLIVLRPGPEGFTPAALSVVACVVFAAIRDLCTRRIAREVPSLFITVLTSVVITLVGAALIGPTGGWRPVGPESLAHLAGASFLLLIGYQCIVLAMRNGEISFVAPFRYTSLIWSIGLGLIFFAEVPDVWMVTGILVIVGSGLYTFYRENRRRVAAIAQTSEPGTPK